MNLARRGYNPGAIGNIRINDLLNLLTLYSCSCVPFSLAVSVDRKA